MPFGKYQRKEMGNVPADYLLWLYDQFKKQESPLSHDARRVKEYIEENLDALQLEVKRNAENKENYRT
jgi:uncharacterized protein (DUF3820 family)